MTTGPSEDNAKGLAASAGETGPVQVNKEMIASNIDESVRVAPAVEKMSIIEDLYSFADRLRTGSTPGGGRKE